MSRSSSMADVTAPASPDRKRKQPAPAASPTHPTHLTPKKQRVGAASAASVASPAPCTPPPRHPTASSSATATTPVTGPLLPADESVGVTIRACRLTPRKDVQAQLSEELDYLLASDRYNNNEKQRRRSPLRDPASRPCPLSEQLKRHVPRTDAAVAAANAHGSVLHAASASPGRSLRIGGGSSLAAIAASLAAKAAANGSEAPLPDGSGTTAATSSSPTSSAAPVATAADVAPAAAAPPARPPSVTPPARRVKLFASPSPAASATATTASVSRLRTRQSQAAAAVGLGSAPAPRTSPRKKPTASSSKQLF